MEVGQFKIGAIIQARLGSTRFPNKALMSLPLGGNETILSQVINGVKKAPRVSKIIVASSISLVNDDLEKHVSDFNIDCYRGDENDVLSRFYEIVKKHKFDFVIRFTADNPIIDESLLEEFIANFIAKDLDYSCSQNLPLGCNFEMMKAEQIIEAFENTENLYDKEHVTPYIKRHSKKIEYYTFKEVEFNKELRLTIDYPSDYAFIGLIYSMLKEEPKSLKNIFKLIEKNHWVLNINQHNFQKKNHKNIGEEIENILPIIKERELKRLERLLKNVAK